MLDDEGMIHTDRNEGFAHNEDKVMVIPVLEEVAVVSKQRVETAKVTVTKTVSEKTTVADVMLQSETYNVEHVAINEYIDEKNPPAARQDGDTLILPVVKEVMVKRLLLVEEVRITKKVTQTAEPQHITLRTESIDVKRTPVTENGMI